MKATANAGFIFTGWSGDVSGTNDVPRLQGPPNDEALAAHRADVSLARQDALARRAAERVGFADQLHISLKLEGIGAGRVIWTSRAAVVGQVLFDDARTRRHGQRA